MLNKVVSFFLCVVIFLTSATSFADPPAIPDAPKPVPGEVDLGAVVSPLRKGQGAPYTGVLMSPKAVATIMTQLRSIAVQTQIEVDKAKATDKANCDFDLAEQKNTLETDKKILQAGLDAKDKQIEVINDQLKKEQSKMPITLWLGLGFGGGVLVTVLTTVAVVKLTK